MKKNLFILMVIMILPFHKISSQCAQTANIYTFSYNGHNYEIVKELKTWNNANLCAIERGGYLVQIEDSAENVKLMSSIASAGISATYHPTNDGGGASYIWTGGNDRGNEGTWLWEGSSTIFYYGQGTAGMGGGSVIGNAFVNWGCSSLCEPDNFFYFQDQDGLGLSLGAWPYGNAGKWNDIDVNNTLYFIIEKNGTEINENIDLKGIELFLHPNKDFIQIKNIENQEANIKIINVEGKIINDYMFSDLSEGKIIISNLINGIYFVNVISRNSQKTMKFTK